MAQDHPATDRLDRTLAEMRERLGSAELGGVYGHRVSRRAFLGRTIAGTTLAAGGLALASRWDADLWDGTADARTTIGQTGHIDLANAARLTMAPETALDLRNGDGVSGIHLRHGTILVEPATAGPTRPVRVETALGRVDARSAPFQASVSRSRLAVSAASAPVTVHDHQGGQLTARPGYTLQLARSDHWETPADWTSVSAWTNGELIVGNGTLGDIVSGLRPYWRGHLLVSPRAAAIPAAGVFSLLQVDRSLAQLAADFPIEIHHLPFRNILVTATG